MLGAFHIRYHGAIAYTFIITHATGQKLDTFRIFSNFFCFFCENCFFSTQGAEISFVFTWIFSAIGLLLFFLPFSPPEFVLFLFLSRKSGLNYSIDCSDLPLRLDYPLEMPSFFLTSSLLSSIAGAFWISLFASSRSIEIEYFTSFSFCRSSRVSGL